MTIGKNIALTVWTFICKVMSLMSSFVIASLPRNKHLLISWLVSLSTVILEQKKLKSITAYSFSFYLPWSDGTTCHDLSFLLSFKLAFSFSSFTLIKRFFRSSSISAIRVVLSAYLRLLIFLLAILIPDYDSSSQIFRMIYSTQKLNKQGDNIQPWRTPFPIWNQSIVPCPVQTVASWPAYWFLEANQVVWYSHLFQNFPQFIVIHITQIQNCCVLSNSEGHGDGLLWKTKFFWKWF